jgi:tetratricopeptide (TPR) repeat protein
LLDEYHSRVRRKRRQFRPEVSRTEAFEAALKQVEWIAIRFETGHVHAAWNDVVDLARQQLRDGDPDKLAMSLTSLATRLRRYEQVAFPLSDLAEMCAPDDPAVWNSRAELLREWGRLAEALAAYDCTVEDFPQNVVARNGRAETLRALGRFDEALAAYDRTVEDFPQDVVARNGRAVVLVELGRLNEAREVLKHIELAPRTAGDWVALHILCMIEFRQRITASLAERLEKFASECPYRSQRLYFETTLAVARIALKRMSEARRDLRVIASRPELEADDRAAVKLMEAHTEAADGDFVAAQQSIAAASNVVSFEQFRKLRQLRQEIEKRFGLGATPAPIRADELAAADNTLVRLEMDFWVERTQEKTEMRRAA